MQDIYSYYNFEREVGLKAVILGAGRGDRLAELSQNRQ
jgi:hypothetical protein